MWSKDRFSMVSTTMWSMCDSVPGAKFQAGLGLVLVGQSAGVCGMKMFSGTEWVITIWSFSPSPCRSKISMLWPSSISTSSSEIPPTSHEVTVELMPSRAVRAL